MPDSSSNKPVAGPPSGGTRSPIFVAADKVEAALEAVQVAHNELVSVAYKLSERASQTPPTPPCDRWPTSDPALSHCGYHEAELALAVSERDRLRGDAPPPTDDLTLRICRAVWPIFHPDTKYDGWAHWPTAQRMEYAVRAALRVGAPTDSEYYHGKHDPGGPFGVAP